MPDFRYEATDEFGELIEGTLPAGSLRQAIATLKQQGIHIRRIEAIGQHPSHSAPATNPSPSQTNTDDTAVELVEFPEEALEITEFLSPLSQEGAANLAEILSDAIQHELPLEPALRAAAEEAPRAEAGVLLALADQIASGANPEQAFEAVRHALPATLAAIIPAGLQANQLPKLLSQYVVLARENASARASWILILLYPAFIALACVVLLGITFLWLIPSMESLYENLENLRTEMPLLTQFVRNTSKLLRSHGLYLLFALLIALVVAVTTWIYLRRGAAQRAKAPIFHKLSLAVDWSDWSTFCALLSLLVQARQPLPRALRTVSFSIGSPMLQAMSERMAANIESGFTPWETTLHSRMPAPIRHAFRWAGDSEQFTEALDGLAEIYRQRNQRLRNLVPIILEPILLIGISLIVGIVAIAVFLPLIQLLNDLT